MNKHIPSHLTSNRNENNGFAPLLRSCKRMAAAFFLLAITGTVIAPAHNAGAETVRDGDQAPKIELLNENDRTIQLSTDERSTLMTFIFTRCAAMEFCPRMNSKFTTLQASLKEEGLADRLRLLSISLDPEFDRPERLREFGKAIKADPSIWYFATGSKAQIDSLTKDFRVFRENKAGILNHTLCTALIRPDGTVEKIWRGNYWKPEDVLQKIR